LFSSAAAIVGGLGMAAYAAANAYLDALALARHAQNLPATSCNWGLWAHGALATSDQRARFAATGMQPMATAPALDALARAITTHRPQHFIAALDRPRYHAVLTARGPRPLLSALAPRGPTTATTTATTALRTRLAAASPGEARRLLHELVAGEAARVLGYGPGEAPPPQRGFFDLGMDSILAAQFAMALGRALGEPLPATLTFERPTIAALTDHLVATLLAAPAPAPPVSAPAIVRTGTGRVPIAVVGLGCRFPGDASDPERFWHNLTHGLDAVGPLPRDRWDLDAFHDPDPAVPGRMYTRDGGFLRDVDRFDPLAFGISPRDGASMDPQHRLLLEVAWEALERAGQPPTGLAGSRTGVYVGVTVSDYARLLDAQPPETIDTYSMTGSLLNFASGRLSYALGLQGPSLAVDTACSSSLVA
ncbi:MAG: KR domain-containing protein, partial [Myxococcales bacterium]|nr:KR domain-containing protein [Myxococcales bacterium]